jgi:hypothetical protein
MAHELRTLVSPLLLPARAARLTEVRVGQEDVLLQLTATAPTACCPRCAVPLSSVRGPYQRHLKDVPWGTRPVCFQLTG